MRNLMISMVLTFSALAGCASNDMSATLDDEAQSFEEVEVAITAELTAYRIVATGTIEDGKANDQLEVVMTLDAETVRALEDGASLSFSGNAAFQGTQEGDPGFSAAASHDTAVRGAWLRYTCDDCERNGNEMQAVEGTLTLDEITDEQLAGTLTMAVEGQIPSWKPTESGGAKASIDVSFDAPITTP